MPLRNGGECHFCDYTCEGAVFANGSLNSAIYAKNLPLLSLTRLEGSVVRWTRTRALITRI